MGMSRRWVQDIEGGQRQSDPRISVIERAAEALRVPVEALLSDAGSERHSECIDPTEVAAIREVLQRHDVITGVFQNADPVDLPTLRRSVGYGWDAFQATDYSGLGRLLPQLVVDAQVAAGALAGDEQLEAFSLASTTYQLASSTLIKFADVGLAWRAADRGVLMAERSGDPVTIGSASRRLADAMLSHGEGEAGASLAIAVAERLEASLLVYGDEDGLSVLGMLYLKAAVAMAEQGNRPQATALLDEAHRVAEVLGRDSNAQWTAFGPTNVQVHRVSTLVQLNAGMDAVDAAMRITPEALAALPRERRAHLLVDIALGYSQGKRRPAAVTTLLAAEELAPQEVRCRPTSHGLVRELVTLAPTPSWELRGLAERCGLTS